MKSGLKKLCLGASLCLFLVSTFPARGADGQLTREDEDWLKEVAYLITNAEIKRFQSMKKEADREKFKEEFWKRPIPGSKEGKKREEIRKLYEKRIDYCEKSFKEPQTSERSRTWLTDRGYIMFRIGIPSERYHGVEVDWTGKGRTLEKVENLSELNDKLQETPAAGEESESTGLGEGLSEDWAVSGGFGAITDETGLSGKLPTEYWVYSMRDPGKVRVLTFVDPERTGAFYLLEERILAATEEIASTTPEKFGADWFPQDMAAMEFEEIPVPTGDLKMKVSEDFFAAREGRTQLFVSVLLTDKRIERADLDPAEFIKNVALYLVVKKANGSKVFQAEFDKSMERTSDGDHLFALAAPLVPGGYVREIVAVDLDRKGGIDSEKIVIPSFTKGFAMSSIVIAKAPQDEKGEPFLEETSGAAADSAEEGADPYGYGKYRIVPEADRKFREGDWIAFYFQVYNSDRAVVNYDVEYEGMWGGSLDETKIRTKKPEYEIVQFLKVEGWNEGKYALKVKAKDERTGKELLGDVSFKVIE